MTTDSHHYWSSKPWQPMPWASEAACKGMSGNLFLPEYRQSPAVALAACARCSVRVECLEYAIKHRAPGIWGGTEERQRNEIRSARRAS
jgi:WhiB family redox-sensing transcriptional regulator